MKAFLKHVIRAVLTLSLVGTAISLPAWADETETAIHPVRGFLPDLRFSLDGAKGRTYTEQDLRGSTVLLFFGYASCPDICPTTMLQLAEVVELLHDEDADIRIVFISVDPHRDTPDVLQAYVDLFNDQALGLTGSEKQIADIARRYRVSYQIEKPRADDPDDYEVAHSRGIYVFDKAGKARLLAADGESVERLAEAVRKLL